VQRSEPVLPAGGHYGRCAVVGSRRRDAAPPHAEGREAAIGGKR
jgi:hypothetical protein